MTEKTRSLGSILRPILSGNRDAALNADAVGAKGPGLDASTTAAAHAEAAHKPHEELCPHCGRLNPVGRQICLDCNQPLPLESVKTLFQGQERQEVIREGIKLGIILLVVSVLMAVSNFIPVTGRIFIILGTILFLIWRFLARITDD